MDTLLDWLKTFFAIIIKPLPKTFITEAEKAKGKLPSAIAWTEFVVLAMHISIFITNKRFSPLSTIISSAIVFPIIFLFYVFSIHLLYQRLYGRKKYYHDELLYILTGIFVPFLVISMFIEAIIPLGTLRDILFWLTLAYPCALSIIAIMAITKLKIWQSAIVAFLGLVMATAGIFCIPAFIGSLMGTIPRLF